MLTRAGPEIGVASTKAFTTQLAALSMLVVRSPSTTARRRTRARARAAPARIPSLIEATLTLDR